MSILILGAQGQLGTTLCEKLGNQAIGCGRQAVDITNPDSIAKILDDVKPTCVVNAAAYNLVDQAEDEPAAAYSVNALGPRAIAAACELRQLTFLHVSSDYVFGHSPSDSPLDESALPEPVSAYGVSKLAGEYFTRSLCQRHFVVRTCGLYGHAARTGAGKGNFVETMLRLAADREELRIVDDQHCVPTFVNDLADAILSLLKTNAYGLYHATNQGACTWARFAEEIFRIEQTGTRVTRIPSSEYPTKAQRPRYSLLSCDKLKSATGLSMRPWQDALREYLDQRKAELS